MTQLQALGIDTLDLLVASHNHADHIGGMPAVLGSTKVRYYLDNGVPHTTATYQRTIQATIDLRRYTYSHGDGPGYIDPRVSICWADPVTVP